MSLSALASMSDPGRLAARAVGCLTGREPRVRERLYDIAGSLHHVAQGGAFQNGLVGLPAVDLLEARRLLAAYESTAPEPLTRDEHRWLPGALALIPLHWATTAGLVGDGIREAESAMTAAEAWWSRRGELSS